MKQPLQCHGSSELVTPQGAEEELKGCYWPNDQGTTVMRMNLVIVDSTYLRMYYFIIIIETNSKS